MNSRSKGNRAERIAAEVISEWTGRKFSKTPASGGLQWQKSFSKGDIVCTVEGHLFPFCVEVKHHKDINFSHLLIPEIQHVKVLEFWEQCQRDAKICSKVPMLLMRYDGMPGKKKGNMFFMVLPLKYTIAINLQPSKKDAFLVYGRGKRRLFIMDSREFFKLPYKDIKLRTKQYLRNGKK